MYSVFSLKKWLTLKNIGEYDKKFNCYAERKWLAGSVCVCEVSQASPGPKEFTFNVTHSGLIHLATRKSSEQQKVHIWVLRLLF